MYLLRIAVLIWVFCFNPKVYANVIGSDAQNFNPTPNGIDFVTVQSSETLRPGFFNLGLFINYAANTLAFPQETGGSKRIGGIRDSLTGMDLNVGLGLLPNWDVGVSFPFILKQVIPNADQDRVEFANVGNTEIKLYTKYRLFGDQSHGVAFIFTINQNQTENNPYIGEGGRWQKSSDLSGI